MEKVMESKLVLKSKTILGIVLSTVVLWAPQFGIDFGEGDKTFLEEAWNELLATAMGAFAVYGRIVADTKVRFK